MSYTPKHFVGSLAVLGLLLGALPAIAAQDTFQEQEKPEHHLPEVAPAAKPSITSEAIVEAVKRRALQILEARRKAKRLRHYLEFSQVIGYETNPLNTGSRKGDTFIEEDSYVLFSKYLTETLTWSGSYYGIYTKYLQLGEVDYTSHTLTPVKLRWQPTKMWRVETWMDLDYLYYPISEDASYRQLKPVVRIRQDVGKGWYHHVQYEWAGRGYLHRRARDGDGEETLSRRQDHRNRLRHRVGTTMPKLWRVTGVSCYVENDWYTNDSNDGLQNFYDYDVWKLTGSLSGDLTNKWSVSANYAFERKNYDARKVIGITEEARYDDKHSVSTSLAYNLNDTWRMSTGFAYDHLDSNEPTGEFDNAKYSLTLTAHF